MDQLDVPGMRTHPPQAAAAARKKFIDHGPRQDNPVVCRACGRLWQCEDHRAAEDWLFPTRARTHVEGHGAPILDRRPRPHLPRLATATMTGANAYPHVGTNPTQGRGADVQPADIYNPRKVHP